MQQLASLIHKSAAFQSDSYERITKRMYPRMDQHKLMLIVELLEELDPRDASNVKSDRQTVDQRKYSEGYLDALMNPLEKPKFDLQHKFLNARNILNSEKVMLISCTLMGFEVAVTHAKLFHTITGVQS